MSITIVSILLLCLYCIRKECQRERNELLEILKQRQKMYDELYEKYKNDVIEEDL